MTHSKFIKPNSVYISLNNGLLKCQYHYLIVSKVVFLVLWKRSRVQFLGKSFIQFVNGPTSCHNQIFPSFFLRMDNCTSMTASPNFHLRQILQTLNFTIMRQCHLINKSVETTKKVSLSSKGSSCSSSSIYLARFLSNKLFLWWKSRAYYFKLSIK